MADTAAVLVDCFSVVHMHFPLVTPDACLSARAAIRAAEIQAKATRSAGTLSFISGGMALFAGLLAVGAAVTDQVLRRRAELLLRKALIDRLRLLITHTDANLKTLEQLFVDNSELKPLYDIPEDDMYHVVYDGTPNYTFISDLRDALSHQNWRDIALLPMEAIELAYGLGGSLQGIIERFAIIRDNSNYHTINNDVYRLTRYDGITENAAIRGLELVRIAKIQQEEFKQILTRK